MEYIGEFHKNSTILLELVTKDNNDEPISADSPPTAHIESYDVDSVNEIAYVTLVEKELGVYQYLCPIPETWAYGDYMITYQVVLDSSVFETKETFKLSETDTLVRKNQELILDAIDAIESLGLDGEQENADTQDELIFAPPSEFQIPAKVTIQGNRITIALQQPIQFNHNYTLVVDRSLYSTSGSVLDKKYVFSYSSMYKPLYATPLEVRAVLKQLYSVFSLEEIYVAIRNAGQKVHQLLKQIPDANNTRFRELGDRDSSFFPATKFVIYESSRSLISSLLTRIAEGAMGQGITAGDSMILGDLEISSSSGTESKDPTKMIYAMIPEIESQLKFWQDAMMGRNARGYAKPVTASTRLNNAGSPPARSIDG